MVTIHVTINGGVAPIPVEVVITNLANNKEIQYFSPVSFQKSTDLDPGYYSINVCGQNPQNGYTDVSISGKFASDPMPSSQQRCDTPDYSTFFAIQI